MSKQTTTPVTHTKKAVAIALAPYIVILVMATTLGGTILGWTLRSDDNGRVQAAANQLVENLAKELKQ